MSYAGATSRLDFVRTTYARWDALPRYCGLHLRTTLFQGGAEKGYDPVTFDLLKVNAMDIATQITLRDLPIFESITVEVIRQLTEVTKTVKSLGTQLMRVDLEGEARGSTEHLRVHVPVQRHLSVDAAGDPQRCEAEQTRRAALPLHRYCEGNDLLHIRRRF